MPSDRSLLEREMQRLELRPFTLEGFHRGRERRQRNQRVAAGVLGIAVFALAAIGFVRLLGSERTPAGEPRGPFEGTWVSTSDTDGGTQTMSVRATADGAVEVLVHDDVATVCSGTPSTMTGTGRLEGETELVIPAPVYTCDDGSEPEALSGPPLEEQLRDLTFVLDAQTETLTDNFGGVWLRPGAEDANPEPITSGNMWPQTTLEEVQEAQELADAGDPDYTWQVEPQLHSKLAGLGDVEFLDRFLREELGWDSAIFHPFLGWSGSSDVPGDRSETGLVFIRCAPGETNPLYPDDPHAGRCAPTVDDFRYETVEIDVAQLGTQSPSGIWVVTSWRQPGPWFQQMTPPSEAEVTQLLNGFLEARVAGEGAQQYVNVPEEDIPLLYVTTAGAPYERAEFERVRGPLWPNGAMEFTVRLFAEGGETVVEQRFSMEPAGGGLRLDFSGRPTDGVPATTENGQVVAEEYSIVDGEVTFAAANPPWSFADWAGWTRTMITLLHEDGYQGLRVVADPLPVGTGCQADPAPADTEALAARILSDPDIDATEPVPVRIAGIDALQMDVAPAPGASICHRGNEPLLVTSDEPHNSTDLSLWHRHSYRLYLLDVPSGSSEVLVIEIFAFDETFERVVEDAAPLLDSLEFHAP